MPAKVIASGRAPSWKALAIALLKNDLQLYGLGFAKPCWEAQQETLEKAHIAFNTPNHHPKQLDLFK